MKSVQSRRAFIATLSSASATILIGGERGSAQEPPPEVTTIRLTKTPGICIAPQYVAEALLKIEGFRDIQYVEVPLDLVHRSAGTDKIDIHMGFTNCPLTDARQFDILPYNSCVSGIGCKPIDEIPSR